MQASTSRVLDREDEDAPEDQLDDDSNAGDGPEAAAGFAPPAPVTSATAAASGGAGAKKNNKRAAKSRAGGADDDDDEAKCRRRKLKCDRGYPCGACRDRQEGHLCEWEGAIRLPQPHLTRDAELQELRGQLDRFENLLNNLASGSPLPSATTTSSDVSGLSVTAGAAVDAGASGASGNASLSFVGPDLPNSRSLAQLSQPNASASKIANSNSRAQMLAHAQSVGHLVGLLPSRRELDVLVARFLGSEPNFLPVAHVPSFQTRYNNFNAGAAHDDPFFLAFLFSIVSYEMGWQLADPELSKTAGVQKDSAMKRLFEAASEALRMAGFLESRSLDVVRTLIVLYQCAAQQCDARAGYLLTQAVQVAQSLGLHRDPTKAGITDVIEAEERRRLWYILVAFDALEQPGRLSIISSEQYDTEPPANAYDHEITAEGVVSRPFPTFTPALYLELLRKLGEYNSLISQAFFAVKVKEPITWSRVRSSNAGLDRMKASYPSLSWRNGLVEPLSEDSFASDRFRVLAHTALLKLDIRVNRPFLSRGLVDSRLQEGRTRVLDAAHQLLGIWLAYPDHSQVSRLWQLAYHGLNAICIIAIDLFQDPKGARADAHRKFLAMSAGRLDKPEYKSKLAQEVLRVADVLKKSSEAFAHLPTRTPSSPAAAAASGDDFVLTSLPLPLTIDPFAYVVSTRSTTASERDPELVTLWHELVASYPSMYAVPDKKEWEELTKRDGAPWRDGVDLFVSD